MENQVDSKSTVIKYGLLTGAVSIIIALIGYAKGNVANPGIILSILAFIGPIVVLVLGIKAFKTEKGGYISWGEAVKVGIGIALIWAILALGFQYILENFIDTNILVQKEEFLRESLEKWGVSEELIEESLEKEKNRNPLLGISMGILMFAFIGFVVSAIAGAVMKNEEADEY